MVAEFVYTVKCDKCGAATGSKTPEGIRYANEQMAAHIKITHGPNRRRIGGKATS